MIVSLVSYVQSYELQPPGTTFFWVLEHPENGGGDTLFASLVEAYNRLSPELKKRIESLRAVHSAFGMAEHTKKYGGHVRREPIETEVSPVTQDSFCRSLSSFSSVAPASCCQSAPCDTAKGSLH